MTSRAGRVVGGGARRGAWSILLVGAVTLGAKCDLPDGIAGSPPDAAVPIDAGCDTTATGLWQGEILDLDGRPEPVWAWFRTRDDGQRMAAYLFGTTDGTLVRDGSAGSKLTLDYDLSAPDTAHPTLRRSHGFLSIDPCTQSPGSATVSREDGTSVTHTVSWQRADPSALDLRERRFVIYPLDATESDATVSPAVLWSDTDFPVRWTLALADSARGGWHGMLETQCDRWSCGGMVTAVAETDGQLVVTVQPRGSTSTGTITLVWDAAIGNYRGSWQLGTEGGRLIAGIDGMTTGGDVSDVVGTFVNLADALEKGNEFKAGTIVHAGYDHPGVSREDLVTALVASERPAGDAGPPRTQIQHLSRIQSRSDTTFGMWANPAGTAQFTLTLPDGCQTTSGNPLGRATTAWPDLHPDYSSQPGCSADQPLGSWLGFVTAPWVAQRVTPLYGIDGGTPPTEPIGAHSWESNEARIIAGWCNRGVETTTTVDRLGTHVTTNRNMGLPLRCSQLPRRLPPQGIPAGGGTVPAADPPTHPVTPGPRFGQHMEYGGEHQPGHFGIDFSSEGWEAGGGAGRQIDLIAPTAMAPKTYDLSLASSVPGLNEYGLPGFEACGDPLPITCYPGIPGTFGPVTACIPPPNSQRRYIDIPEGISRCFSTFGQLVPDLAAPFGQYPAEESSQSESGGLQPTACGAPGPGTSSTFPGGNTNVHYAILVPVKLTSTDPAFTAAIARAPSVLGAYDNTRCPWLDMNPGARGTMLGFSTTSALGSGTPTATADPVEPMLCNPTVLGGVTVYGLPSFVTTPHGNGTPCDVPWNTDDNCWSDWRVGSAREVHVGGNPSSPGYTFGPDTDFLAYGPNGWWKEPSSTHLTAEATLDPSGDAVPGGGVPDGNMCSTAGGSAGDGAGTGSNTQVVAPDFVQAQSENKVSRGVGQVTTVWVRRPYWGVQTYNQPTPLSTFGTDAYPDIVVAAMRLDWVDAQLNPGAGGLPPFLQHRGNDSTDADRDLAYRCSQNPLQQGCPASDENGWEWKASVGLGDHGRRCTWLWFEGDSDPTTRAGGDMWSQSRTGPFGAQHHAGPAIDGWWWYGQTASFLSHGSADPNTWSGARPIDYGAGRSFDESFGTLDPATADTALSGRVQVGTGVGDALAFEPNPRNIYATYTGGLGRFAVANTTTDLGRGDPAADPGLNARLAASPEYQIDPLWSDPVRQGLLAAHFPCFRDGTQASDPACTPHAGTTPPSSCFRQRSDPSEGGQYALSTRDPAVAVGRFYPLP